MFRSCYLSIATLTFCALSGCVEALPFPSVDGSVDEEADSGPLSDGDAEPIFHPPRVDGRCTQADCSGQEEPSQTEAWCVVGPAVAVCAQAADGTCRLELQCERGDCSGGNQKCQPPRDPCRDLSSRVEAALVPSQACETSDDCRVVGACSGGLGFFAVAHSSASTIEALLADTPPECAHYDGPLYDAVCEQGRCTLSPNGRQCGQAVEPTCAEGEDYLVPGCVSEGQRAVEAGCYRACEGPLDPSCTLGSGCAQAWYDPCAGSACAACAAEAWLCLP